MVAMLEELGIQTKEPGFIWRPDAMNDRRRRMPGPARQLGVDTPRN
jgi:hypothetical protein